MKYKSYESFLYGKIENSDFKRLQFPSTLKKLPAGTFYVDFIIHHIQHSESRFVRHPGIQK